MEGGSGRVKVGSFRTGARDCGAVWVFVARWEDAREPSSHVARRRGESGFVLRRRARREC